MSAASLLDTIEEGRAIGADAFEHLLGEYAERLTAQSSAAEIRRAAAAHVCDLLALAPRTYARAAGGFPDRAAAFVRLRTGRSGR